METINVIGPGRWGTFLAWYLVKHKNLSKVSLYGLENSITFQELNLKRKNEYLTIPNNIYLTSDLNQILKANYIIISVDAQNLKELAIELNGYDLEGKTFILAMKGIDVLSKKRLSQVMFDNIKQNINIAVLLGPGHVEDYTNGIPNCVVVDSNDDSVKVKVIEIMKSNLMRIYYGTDLIGNEIGAAYKNVIGIGAGILDGLKWSSLKGALMSRSIFEVGNFIEKCGGNPKSASGLAFLGDFEATLFSQYSNNRLFGEMLVKGGNTGNKNCEGVHTLKVVYDIGKRFGIELPITDALYKIIYEKNSINEAFDKLFSRDLKKEF